MQFDRSDVSHEQTIVEGNESDDEDPFALRD